MSDDGAAPVDRHRSLRSRLRPVCSTGLALLIGSAGGLAFHALGLPLPWMMGALVATLLVTVPSGLPVVDRRTSVIVFPVLGVLIGSSFHPELIDAIGRWPVGIGAVIAYTVATTLLGYVYFSRVSRWDRVTAFFASPPGGLSEMVLIGGAAGADERRLVLVHSIRIALVVATATIAINTLFAGAPAPPQSPSIPIELFDWLVLAACAVGGGYLGRFLRLPGGPLLGSLILSAAAHLTGLTLVSPPDWLVAGAQVVLGCVLGGRFIGITRREIVGVARHAVAWSLILVMIAFLCSLLLRSVSDIDPRGLFLALAPGGFSEMLLVSLAIGIESAFVATCHVVRIIVIVAFIPFLQATVWSGRTPNPD